MNKQLTVLYFGSFDPLYSRNRIIIKGFKENHVSVLQCRAFGNIFFRYIKLIKEFLKIFREIDVIIVGFPGHDDVPLAYLLGKIFKKKVYFDIFTSKYETYVQDREEFRSISLQGIIYYLVDFLSLHLTDYIISDTKAHLIYYKNKFGINPKKGRVVYLGSDDEIFYPVKKKADSGILFYGYYQPLHGTEIIVKAAKLLPNIKFTLIGHGQDKKYVELFIKKNHLKNVALMDSLSIKELAKAINKAKIILGIFGNTKKADCVIPNKVYDGLACRKPIITCNTQAIREVLTDRVNCLLVKSNDPVNLKNAIVELMGNKNLRTRIANDGYKLFKEKLLPRKIIKDQFIHYIDSL